MMIINTDSQNSIRYAHTAEELRENNWTNKKGNKHSNVYLIQKLSEKLRDSVLVSFVSYSFFIFYSID